VAKAVAAQGQATINQKVAAKMFKILIKKCNIMNITRLRRKEQGAAVCGQEDSGNGVSSRQRQARGQATVAEAEAAQGQTTINQKVEAMAAAMVLVTVKMVAAVAVAVAMATSAMTVKTRQPWQR